MSAPSSASSSPETLSSSSVPSPSPSRLEEGTGSHSSSTSSYGAYPNTIIISERGSESGSEIPENQNIIISTIPEATLDIENESQLIQYLDSFDNSTVPGTLPVRFSSYYTRNDEMDEEYQRGEFQRGEFQRGEFQRGEFQRGEFQRGEFQRGEFQRGEHSDYMDNNNYMETNSPVSMSPCGSEDGGSTHTEDTRFKRVTYADVEKTIEKYYNPTQKFSNEFDILVTYLKGQKNLYIQSKNITQCKLNLLVFPSIILTAFLTVFAPTLSMRGWSVYVISAVNALIAILVAMTNYLKLESKTETYTQLANQYDRLETMIELSSNKLFFMAKETEQNELILNKIKYIENKLNDIKESNSTVLIPEAVKKMFPVIYHINIFSFIKKIETYKKKLIMQFKDVKNEIGYIIYKWNKRGANIFDEEAVITKHLAGQMKTQFVKEQTRLMYLMKTKEKIKYELICYKNSYAQIDELFIREIKNAESLTVWVYALLFGKYKKPIIYEANPAIEDFLKIIFIEI